MDKVRILRIIEYVGEREQVENTISHSIHGTKKMSNDLEIRAATIGEFPEILEETDKEEKNDCPL